MDSSSQCASLEEVRAAIDALDTKIVALILERGKLVSQAAGFKATTDDVKAPKRVEQVIAKVRATALQLGAHPDVVEASYRAMISAFIEVELAEHAALGGAAESVS